MDKIEKYVAIDGIKICSVYDEDNDYYYCNGQASTFKVPKERCKEIDNEFAIISNTRSVCEALRYAMDKGYILNRIVGLSKSLFKPDIPNSKILASKYSLRGNNVK